MFARALTSGERFPAMAWLGLAAAIGGLVYLVAPGVTAPEPVGAVLMAAAGIAWGAYSLLGRGAADATRATAWNFVLSVPLVLVTSIVFIDAFHATPIGIVLAVASGAIASGLGYVVWYAALKDLAASDAATIQLSVPVTRRRPVAGGAADAAARDRVDRDAGRCRGRIEIKSLRRAGRPARRSSRALHCAGAGRRSPACRAGVR